MFIDRRNQKIYNHDIIFIPGLIAVIIMVAIVAELIYNTNKQFKTEYELKRAA